MPEEEPLPEEEPPEEELPPEEEPPEEEPPEEEPPEELDGVGCGVPVGSSSLRGPMKLHPAKQSARMLMVISRRETRMRVSEPSPRRLLTDAQATTQSSSG